MFLFSKSFKAYFYIQLIINLNGNTNEIKHSFNNIIILFILLFYDIISILIQITANYLLTLSHNDF